MELQSRPRQSILPRWSKLDDGEIGANGVVCERHLKMPMIPFEMRSSARIDTASKLTFGYSGNSRETATNENLVEIRTRKARLLPCG